MAKATFLELVNRTIRECGISGGDTVSVTGNTGIRHKVVNWVADADLYIQKKYKDWNFLHKQYSISTIVDTKDYVKPTDLGMWDVDSFYLNYTTADNIRLDNIDYIDWRDNHGMGVQTSSNPYAVAFKPNKDIILYPAPDAIFTMTADYWKIPTRLVANADQSDIPETFEDVIIHRAKILYAQHEEAGDMLSVAKEEYGEGLIDLKANEAPYHTALNRASIQMDVIVE